MEQVFNRRKFLQAAGTSTAALGLAGLTGCASSGGLWDGGQVKKRPNIIFLQTDDQRDNTLGIMGHPWVKTPNLDKLVKKGVRFSNAYIAEPICCPSRVSFLTGMHERVHGVGFTSSYKLNEAQWSKSYPALLRANGYYTGFIGKFGVEYYTFRGQTEKKFDYYMGHDGWAVFFPKSVSEAPALADARAAYQDCEQGIITPIMGESIKHFLDSVPENKPFNLSVSFSVPHGSTTGTMHKWSEPANKNPKLKDHPVYGDLYRDLDIPIPEDTATDPYQFIPQVVHDQNVKWGRKATYSYNYSKEVCKEHHIRYYQLITGLDNVVGDLMATLKEKGLDKNTVIIFGSDHGLLMGEYGMGGKALLYDLTSKYPCFVYDPRLPKDWRGKTIDNLVSSLDITSTILDYAGVSQPGEMQGASLRPLMTDSSIQWRDELFLESLYTGRDTPFSEGIRKGKWKYIRMFDGVVPYKEKHVNFKNRKPDFEQLFDLSKDPEEKNNLIAELERSDILKTLRKRCQEHSDALNNRREEYKKTHEITAR